MRHNHAVTLGLTAMLSIVTVSARRADAQTASEPQRDATAEVRERLNGAPFHFVGGEQQRNTLQQTIDQSVAPMNFIERPIARRRLTDRNRIENTLAFRVQPGNVNVQLGGHATVSRDDFTPAPGRAITGEPMQIRQRIEGDRLVQSLTTSEGERRDEFVLSPDGHRLTMRVTVHSPKLRQPMRYQLSYAR